MKVLHATAALLLAMTTLGFAQEADDMPEESGSICMVDRRGDPVFLTTAASFPFPRVALDPVVEATAHSGQGCTVTFDAQRRVFSVTLRGSVRDPIADLEPSGAADISSVTVTYTDFERDELEASQDVQVQNTSSEQRPTALAPFPFAGRFELGPFEVPVSQTMNEDGVDYLVAAVAVAATNVAGNQGSSMLELRVDLATGTLTVEPYNTQGQGYDNPILVLIDDPRVNPENVGDARATVDGAEFGLRFVDGQLQLDRPLLGVTVDMPAELTHVINATTMQDMLVVRYGDDEFELCFNYTSHGE